MQTATVKRPQMQRAFGQGTGALRQIFVPNEKNSTVSIPSEFYGMEVEVVVYPIYVASKNEKMEAYNNLQKYRGTLKRDIDYKQARNDYLDEKYGSSN